MNDSTTQQDLDQIIFIAQRQAHTEADCADFPTRESLERISHHLGRQMTEEESKAFSKTISDYQKGAARYAAEMDAEHDRKPEGYDEDAARYAAEMDAEQAAAFGGDS